MRPVLIDGGFLDMRYLGKAARIDEPATYDAAFLIANHRVRGVGYCAIARNNFRFKKRIPQGWHQNVCDPNLPTHDERQNIHQLLDGFDPKDYRDFINQTTHPRKCRLGMGRRSILMTGETNLTASYLRESLMAFWGEALAPSSRARRVSSSRCLPRFRTDGRVSWKSPSPHRTTTGSATGARPWPGWSN
jgi:hypothetical protein